MPFLPVYPCLKYCSDINHQPIPPAFQMLSQMIWPCTCDAQATLTSSGNEQL